MQAYSGNWLSNAAQDQRCDFRGSVAYDKCHIAEAETNGQQGLKRKQWSNRRQWVEHLFLLSTQHVLLVLVTSTQNACGVCSLKENQDRLVYKTRILWNPVLAQFPLLFKTLYHFLISTKDKMKWPLLLLQVSLFLWSPTVSILNHRKNISALRFSSCC